MFAITERLIYKYVVLRYSCTTVYTHRTKLIQDDEAARAEPLPALAGWLTATPPATPALPTLSLNSPWVPTVQIPVAIIRERSTGYRTMQWVSHLLIMSLFLNALYPEWRSRCPGWPGICWCWHLPSALCLRWTQHQPSRCPPGRPGGSYLTSYEAALRQTTPVTFSNISEWCLWAPLRSTQATGTSWLSCGHLHTAQIYTNIG